MMCERLSQRPGDRTKLLRERYYIPKHAPYFHTPPPRSSSSRLVKKKKKKNGPETFYGKVLKGRKGKKKKGEKKKERERVRVTKYGTIP